MKITKVSVPLLSVLMLLAEPSTAYAAEFISAGERGNLKNNFRSVPEPGQQLKRFMRPPFSEKEVTETIPSGTILCESPTDVRLTALRQNTGACWLTPVRIRVLVTPVRSLEEDSRLVIVRFDYNTSRSTILPFAGKMGRTAFGLYRQPNRQQPDI